MIIIGVIKIRAGCRIRDLNSVVCYLVSPNFSSVDPTDSGCLLCVGGHLTFVPELEILLII